MTYRTALPLLLLAACTSANVSDSGKPPGGTVSDPTVPGGPGAPGSAAMGTARAPSTGATTFAVHEWGTFTSIVGSGGQEIAGMQHEEEALPGFVSSRANFSKGLEQGVTGVTQKLETPVLYFYSAESMQVKVSVDFPLGIVSQWFPDALAFEPPVNSLRGVAEGGHMEWLATLAPGATDFPQVPAGSIWAPSRRVPSVPVKVGGTSEQFIFYRGVGTFTTPFSVSAEQDGSFTLRNTSTDDVPEVFLLRVHEGGGAIVPLGQLAANATRGGIWSPAGGKEIDLDSYVMHAGGMIAEALARSGLTDEEAQAMVDTWSRSYFRNFGTRLLFIVPRSWTDQLLPIAITPRPDVLVRTLVGRVELLSRADEAELASMVTAAAKDGAPVRGVVDGLGRLAEPKLRRTAALLSDPAARDYCTTAIAVATELP